MPKIALVIRVSIHAPRERSDEQLQAVVRQMVFQSTLPVRGATAVPALVHSVPVVSIHAPRERSDAAVVYVETDLIWFQSTLPVRGATIHGGDWAATFEFQSTLPVRGATVDYSAAVGGLGVSIHAPRERSDLSAAVALGDPELVSIHAPRERSDL